MIRKANNKDINELSELNEHSLSHINWAHDKTHIRNTLKSGNYFVYVIDNKIVGSVKAYLEHNRVWINTISVHKDYHRQGIGSKLIKHIVKKAKRLNYDKVVLYTDTNATHNKGFYEKQGFIEVERKRERKHMWVKFEKII